MDSQKTLSTVNQYYDNWYIEGMKDFIGIPNLTTMVDPTYLTNGKLEECIELVDKYVQKLQIKGLSRQIVNLKECKVPPLIIYTIEGNECSKNIMIYGHLDKQPYGEGWDQDKHPTKATIIGDRMYGRGGADDGYSVFSCMLAIKSIQDQGLPMGRVAMVLETEEESGSPHLIRLLTEASHIIQDVHVCICMDSGAMDYDQLWMTSSLRGIACVDFNVQCGVIGYHSGEVGGIVPETFRIVRELLDRIDDSKTGKVVDDFQVVIPEWKIEEAKMLVEMKNDEIFKKYKVVDNCNYCTEGGLEQMYLNNVWNANLSITGINGIPEIQIAGNVVRANTGLRLSLRLPPNYDSQKAVQILEQKLTTNVPYNAQVTITKSRGGNGWCMQELQPQFMEAIQKAGAAFFEGKATKSYGMGGSIPFLSELGKMYPMTQIIALGLLGPDANAHGPNEMLHLGYAKKLTCALAHIIQAVQ